MRCCGDNSTPSLRGAAGRPGSSPLTDLLFVAISLALGLLIAAVPLVGVALAFVTGRAEQPRGAIWVEDRAGGLGRGLLEGLGGAGHCRGGVDELAGEGAEEAAPAEVDGGTGGSGRHVGRARFRRLERLATGIRLAGGVGHCADL